MICYSSFNKKLNKMKNTLELIVCQSLINKLKYFTVLNKIFLKSIYLYDLRNSITVELSAQIKMTEIQIKASLRNFTLISINV